jgi:cytochrome c
VKLRFAIVASVLMGVSFAAAAQSAEEKLAQSKNCLACHQIDKKLVGPAYKDVAAKYAGDAGALDRLAKKVREGGTGVWGQIPMPPNPKVSEAEAKTLVAWVLSMKK